MNGVMNRGMTGAAPRECAAAALPTVGTML